MWRFEYLIVRMRPWQGGCEDWILFFVLNWRAILVLRSLKARLNWRSSARIMMCGLSSCTWKRATCADTPMQNASPLPIEHGCWTMESQRLSTPASTMCRIRSFAESGRSGCTKAAGKWAWPLLWSILQERTCCTPVLYREVLLRLHHLPLQARSSPGNIPLCPTATFWYTSWQRMADPFAKYNNNLLRIV